MVKISKVLFLCTGNSCRSQIAEAIVNNILENVWKAYSAGTKPTGFVHPNAIDALKEIGIEHKGKSKHVDEFKNVHFDLVITVCDSASEDCPLWLGTGKKVHIPFPDPASVQGTEEEVREAFRAVRDSIAEKIPGILLKYDRET